MPKIVISYRRRDSEAIAGRIRDRLVGRYGTQSVFMDIDSIPLVVNFREYIADALRHTDVFLAIIGPRWCGDGEDKVRIDHASDPVRIEVEKALELKIPVWPVLVNDAEMPNRSILPESIQELADHNAAFVSSGRDFHPHMDRLIRQIDRFLGTTPDTSQQTSARMAAKQGMLPNSEAKSRRKNSIVAIASLGAAIAVVAVATFFWLGRQNSPPIAADAHVAPPAGAVPCSEERTLRSLGTTTPATIVFVNKSSRPKRIYWLRADPGSS